MRGALSAAVPELGVAHDAWEARLEQLGESLGAIGAWLSPLIRDAMATRRYTSDASLYARELRRWAQYVSRSHPDLPAVPEPPRGWDDHGSLAGESSQDA